jgi:hypothetical protein
MWLAMPKYQVDLLGVVGYGMWGSVPEDVAEEAWTQFWEENPWDDVRPPFAPVIRRHPPTYQEWLDSLRWRPLRPFFPRDDSPDEGRSRLRFRGYSDRVTIDRGQPLRLRSPVFELMPQARRKVRSWQHPRAQPDHGNG